MPRPTKDYARFFAREIAAKDAKLLEALDERRRLVEAYALLTGDVHTYHDTPVGRAVDAVIDALPSPYPDGAGPDAVRPPGAGAEDDAGATRHGRWLGQIRRHAARRDAAADHHTTEEQG